MAVKTTSEADAMLETIEQGRNFDPLTTTKLASIDGPDLLRLIIEFLDEDHCLHAALACRRFSQIVKVMHPNGWQTSPGGVVSSVERFIWVSSLPSPPSWLSNWNKRTCNIIAQHGGLKVLEWVRSQGCPWNADMCATAAAKGGHLNVLRYLRAYGCEFEAQTATAAAQAGQLKVLKWLRGEGCKFTADICVAAARGGHVPVLHWVQGNGCQCEGVFHSPFWLGGRAKGLSRLLSCAAAIKGPGFLPQAAANVAQLEQSS